MSQESTAQDIQLRLELQERLSKTMVLDLGGHFRTGLPGKVEALQDHVMTLWIWSFLRLATKEWIRKLAAGGPVEPIPLSGRSLSYDLRTCGECGATLTGSCDGVVLRLRGPDNTLCPCPNGMPAYSFEIDIPSGRMVVANDLRSYFPVKEDGEEFDIETNMGTRQVTMKYAKEGMAHAFVGNTCPGVYSQGDDHLVIAVCGRIEGTKEGGWRDTLIPPKGKRVASICTDLWWYSIVDEALMRARGFKGKIGGRSRTCEVVQVTPGRYRFTHHYHLLNPDDHTGPQVYTAIERV